MVNLNCANYSANYKLQAMIPTKLALCTFCICLRLARHGLVHVFKHTLDSIAQLGKCMIEEALGLAMSHDNL